MNGDTDNPSNEQTNDNGTDDISAEPEVTPAAAEDVDNVGDMSVEINVEELVAKIESSDLDASEKEREIRKKLDKIQTQKKDDLDSTYNFNIDDEL